MNGFWKAEHRLKTINANDNQRRWRRQYWRLLETWLMPISALRHAYCRWPKRILLYRTSHFDSRLRDVDGQRQMGPQAFKGQWNRATSCLFDSFSTSVWARGRTSPRSHIKNLCNYALQKYSQRIAHAIFTSTRTADNGRVCVRAHCACRFTATITWRLEQLTPDW